MEHSAQELATAHSPALPQVVAAAPAAAGASGSGVRRQSCPRVGAHPFALGPQRLIDRRCSSLQALVKTASRESLVASRESRVAAAGRTDLQSIKGNKAKQGLTHRNTTRKVRAKCGRPAWHQGRIICSRAAIWPLPHLVAVMFAFTLVHLSFKVLNGWYAYGCTCSPPAMHQLPCGPPAPWRQASSGTAASMESCIAAAQAALH